MAERALANHKILSYGIGIFLFLLSCTRAPANPQRSELGTNPELVSTAVELHSQQVEISPAQPLPFLRIYRIIKNYVKTSQDNYAPKSLLVSGEDLAGNYEICWDKL